MDNRTVKATKLMMPGEQQVYRAYNRTKAVVERVAKNQLGYDPDTGFRPATAQERLAEWDSLTPEQRRAIIDKKGVQWYLSQAEEIDTLREALADIEPLPADPGSLPSA